MAEETEWEDVPSQNLNEGIDFNQRPAADIIPDVYSNNSFIVINNSEISIVFSHDIDPSGEIAKPSVRVTMTHANFIIFANYFMKHANFLAEVYEGRPKTLNDILLENPELVQSAFAKLRS